VTPTSPVIPGAAEPTHGCVRCGAPVALGVGLCERCNPLGLRDSSASQVHGTVFLGVVAAFVLLAIVARLAVTGLGPFPATVDAVRPSGPGLEVTLTVRNDGSAAGRTTCRVYARADRGGGRSAFLLSPQLEPAQTLTFRQVVTEFGPEVGDLVVDCRTP